MFLSLGIIGHWWMSGNPAMAFTVLGGLAPLRWHRESEKSMGKPQKSQFLFLIGHTHIKAKCFQLQGVCPWTAGGHSPSDRH